MRPLTPVELRENLEDMQRQFESLCDIYVLHAKTLRVVYEALIREGFTEEDALEIVIMKGVRLLD